MKLNILALALAALPVHADTLVMRDGKEINGTLLGATARQVEFLPDTGKAIKMPLDKVASIDLSEPAAVAPPAPAPPPPAAARKAVTVPAGTAIRVRTIDNIDVDKTQAGAKFRGATDDPIMLGGDVIVPRGADVVLVAAKVQQGGKMKGSDLIELKVTAIKVGARSYPVVTTVTETKTSGEGKKTTKKVLGGAGLGAIVGGIAGGGKGAGIGALVGGVGGTIVAASGQPHLKIPAETRIEFQLTADWKVQ
ncbi:MAG: hypothetical protein ABI759_16575 [Candidatus Solibacter sp.]